MLREGRAGPSGEVLSPQLSVDGLRPASPRQTLPLAADRLPALAWRTAEIWKLSGPARRQLCFTPESVEQGVSVCG